MRQKTCIPKSRINTPTNLVIKEHASINNLFIGDSLLANYQRPDHKDIWAKYFPNDLNVAVRGDKIENALWRVTNYKLPQTVKNVFILVGTNNVPIDSPREIAEGIRNLASVVMDKFPTATCIVFGLLPRGLPHSKERKKIYKTNQILTFNKNVIFVPPSPSWFCGTALNKKLFWRDNLHLLREGYLLLTRLILQQVNNRDESDPPLQKNNAQISSWKAHFEIITSTLFAPKVILSE